ncbi:MAG: tetratricopeptide repeat protein [Sulfurovum sp.]|nr:tetratricopeptide repeat protein [Sulfurovaceae bacterium]
MRKFIKNSASLMPFYVILILSTLWLIFFYNGSWNRLLFTSNQIGYRAFQKGDYMKASKIFDKSSFKGASFYKAGEFKSAKIYYQNLTTKEGKYNLGNANLMLGLYDPAIESYKLALKIDPNFQEAKDNLAVAKARKILKKPENKGDEGVGKLGADKIVFDNKEGKGVDDSKSASQTTNSKNPNWLDRLNTGPKDFLKNKFRYQYEMQKVEQGVNNEKK